MTSAISISPTLTSERFSLVLDIQGMKCAGCSSAIEKRLRQQPGVESITVNLLTGVASLEFAPQSPVSRDEIIQQLTALGFPTQIRYDSRTAGTDDSEGITTQPLVQDQRQALRGQITQLAIAGVLVFLSGAGHLDQLGWLQGTHLAAWGWHWGLATIALFGLGNGILVSGWRGMRQGAPNMNTLISLGTLTAYGTSCLAQLFPQLGWECFFDEPVMLISAVVLGRGLEQKARQKALSTLQILSGLQPQMARLWQGTLTSADLTLDARSDLAVEIPITKVRVGDYLTVLPGETIPVDGELIQGDAVVNEAMITGEAIPVEKVPGDRVIAGSVNYQSPIWLRTTAIGANTTLAHIIQLVETAQTRKAPIQQLADQVAGYFVYSVIAIAILTFGFWYGVGTHLWPQVLLPQNSFTGLSLSAHHAATTHSLSPLLLSLKLAIAVLVVSCPCALGLATPVSILVGTTLGSEKGLLIRGGDVLEQLSQVNTWVFDKTGTLTLGQPEVTAIHVVDEDYLSQFCQQNPPLSPQQILLQWAASVEQHTRHPLAEALLKTAQAQTLARLPVENAQTHPGCGVSGTIWGENVQAGHLAWLQATGLNCPAGLDLAAIASPGATRIYLAIAHQLVGLITLMDTVRPDAKATLTRLAGMDHQILLLTGDQWDSAERISQVLDLDFSQVQAQVTPEQKVNAIRNLQAQGRVVAMIGDGINDAPALAQANVGISLQSSTDAALASADLVILSPQLQDILTAWQLSQATFRIIRQNLAGSIAYNLIGIPLAMGVFLPISGLYLSPATAGVMMSLSSFSVILNSLSLRRLHFQHDISSGT